MSLERSMNNHDKLGNRDIGNFALKLKFGVTVARVSNCVDQGKHDTWDQMAWVQIPVPPLSGHVTL